MPWGHAVAPSTPVQDYRLHVEAWQHHFAAMFGLEALERVRGFSPSEMALPNHPDVAYEFVKTLNECGYHWVLVQEHSVEQSPTAGIRNASTCPIGWSAATPRARGEHYRLDQDTGQRYQAGGADAAVVRGEGLHAGSWAVSRFPHWSRRSLTAKTAG